MPEYASEEGGVGLGKRLISLSDLAEVVDATKERTSYSRYNAYPNISISIQKQAVANIIHVADRIKEELKNIRNDIPEDINFEVVYDQSNFIKEAINGVTIAGVEGGVIAFFVLLYFLTSIRSAAIVSTAIPISVMAAISLMFFRNITVNMMSLAGLALGIGMMVDNSIVVIENISRLRYEGRKAKEAAVEGTVEVGTAVTAATLTTVAVFLPMAFVIGLVGQVFKDLAFTVCFALVASLIVAITLIPRLSVGEKEYKEAKKKTFLSRSIAYPMILINRLYDVVLRLFLKFKYTGLFLTTIVFLFSIVLLVSLNTEFMPKIDQGQFLVKVTMGTGTLLEKTNKVVGKIENFIMELPEVESASVSIGSDKEQGKITGAVESLGSHQGQISVELKKKRKHPSKYTLNKIETAVNDMKRNRELGDADIDYDMKESVFAFGGPGGAPIELEIKGHNLEKLKAIAKSLVKKIKKVPGTFSVKHDFAKPSPETRVNIDKDKAALYGLSVTDIAQSAQTALKGYVATKFKEKGREIDIRVRLRERDRDTLTKLRDVTIYSKLKKMDLPLNEVAYLTRGKGPSEIKRKDQERVITVTSDIYQRPLKDVMKDVDKILKKTHLPSGYKIEIGGEREQMQASFKSLQFALALSILLVYMIMASQFESLLQPFIIMITVPLSLIGVAAALYITNSSLNVVVILGIIMLGGIVVNNGIVLISCANDLRAGGQTAYEAAVRSGQLRLRPILMTTMTTVLGLVPLSLGLAEGGELQQPLAITVMGGLLVSSFLTLVIIPCLYYISEEVMTKVLKRERIVLTDTGPKQLT